MRRSKGSYSVLLYLIFVLLQVFVCNCVNLSPLVTLTVLPALMLCLPLTCAVVPAMLIAFATGLAVDFLGDGIIGLNALALVPVAYLRKLIIGNVLGKDIVIRKDGFSFRKNGFMKVFTALFFCQILFLTVYILADGAGTRPLWFNLARFGASTGAGMIVGLIAVGTLTSSDRR